MAKGASRLPVSVKSPRAQERVWRAQDALRTIQSAEQFKADKGLMRDVQTLAQQQVKVLQLVAGKPTTKR